MHRTLSSMHPMESGLHSLSRLAEKNLLAAHTPEPGEGARRARRAVCERPRRVGRTTSIGRWCIASVDQHISTKCLHHTIHNLARARAGHDAPFVNNYGVWADEFAELGLDGTLDQRWPDAHCWFGEQHEVRVGRAYGRCCSSQANPNPVRVFGWCVCPMRTAASASSTRSA